MLVQLRLVNSFILKRTFLPKLVYKNTRYVTQINKNTDQSILKPIRLFANSNVKTSDSFDKSQIKMKELIDDIQKNSDTESDNKQSTLELKLLIRQHSNHVKWIRFAQENMLNSNIAISILLDTLKDKPSTLAQIITSKNIDVSKIKLENWSFNNIKQFLIDILNEKNYTVCNRTKTEEEINKDKFEYSQPIDKRTTDSIDEYSVLFGNHISDVPIDSYGPFTYEFITQNIFELSKKQYLTYNPDKTIVPNELQEVLDLSIRSLPMRLIGRSIAISTIVNNWDDIMISEVMINIGTGIIGSIKNSNNGHISRDLQNEIWSNLIANVTYYDVTSKAIRLKYDSRLIQLLMTEVSKTWDYESRRHLDIQLTKTINPSWGLGNPIQWLLNKFNKQ